MISLLRKKRKNTFPILTRKIIKTIKQKINKLLNLFLSETIKPRVKITLIENKKWFQMMLKLQIAAVTFCSIFKNLKIQKHEVGDQFHLSINSNPTVGGIPKYRNNRNVISISFKFRFLASINHYFFKKWLFKYYYGFTKY